MHPVSDRQCISLRDACLSDAASIAFVDVESRRDAYRGILPTSFLAKLSVEESRDTWFIKMKEAGALILVAEDAGGKMVGFLHAGPARKPEPDYAGEVYAIYILPSYQRRGLGRRFMRAAAEKLAGRNIHSLLIWVLTANSARKFYESLGGIYLRSASTRIAGLILDGAAYGWKDTSVLLSGADR